jgi:endonuclease VIII
LPEGHTIHRLARDHASWFAGEPVGVSSPQGRFADAARLLDGTVLTGTDAVGKHLFHRYDSGAVVHVHLGLFGRFSPHPTPPPPPRDTVRYRLVGAHRAIDLVGATACELLDDDEVARIVARLGPDPLRRDADPDRAFAALQRRSVSIGRALLDQGVVAGVGNVYRAELLFVHGLHPELPARSVSARRWTEMWATLTTWMRSGVRMRRIVTVDPDEAGVPRSRIRRAEATYVYRQPTCRRCGTPVRRWNLAGRWAYACETCQPPPRR